MKYDLASDEIFFRPVLKVKYVNNCKVIFNFKQMQLFLICQGGWYLGFLGGAIFWEKSYWLSTPGQFLLVSVFIGMTFHTKNKSRARLLFSTEIYKHPTTPNPP